MSSAGEDAIPGFSSSTPQNTLTNSVASNLDSDSDSDSDAPPDFRFLVTTTKTGVHKLPSRGTKDFEPNATSRQQSTLDASRQAMYDALAVLRVHNANGATVGQYFPDWEDWDGARLDEVREGEEVKDQACYDVQVASPDHGDRSESRRRRFRKSGALKVGEGRCVAVHRFTHTYSKTMGAADRRNWTWLLPEEALFLLERGSLDIRWPDTGENQAARNGRDDAASTAATAVELKIGKLPMSLQGAYACLIGKSGLTLERYTVYANLRRAGYVVLRAPTWTGAVADINAEQRKTDIVSPSETAIQSSLSVAKLNPFYLLGRLFAWLFTSSPKPATVPAYNLALGPLISPGIFRNYFDIYRQLSLIPYYTYPNRLDRHISPASSISTSPSKTDQHMMTAAAAAAPPSTRTSSPSPSSSLHISFQIYKPSSIPTFRKSHPPPPDQHLLILNARTTTLPTSRQLGDLLACLPNPSPKPTPHNTHSRPRIETRIKRGTNSFLLAVVDCGIVSYLRIAAGGFGGASTGVAADTNGYGHGDGADGVLWMDNERREIERAVAGQRQGTRGRGAGRGGGRGRGKGRGRRK